MAPSHQYEFGEFRLDTSERALYHQGELVPLTPKALETLLFLFARRGHIVEKDELMKAVWPDTFVEEVSLARNVSVLRKLLSDGRNGRSFIETIPKRGYRFIAPVHELDHEAIPPTSPQQASLEPTAQTEIERSKRPGRLLLIAAALAILLGATGVVLNIGGLRNRFFAYPARQKIRSLAVLPLENLSGDPNQEYFTEGMTDALITDLAKISSLRVVSRTSIMQYKGVHKPLSQIARELGVDAIIEGTVLRSGDKVRVTAQLIRAEHESHLWADMYQRNVGDAMTLQGEIAQAIADHVQAQLTPAERAELSGSRHVNPEVYELYLEGRYYWNKRDSSGLQKGMELFQSAIRKDPGFALGYVGLADTYIVMSDTFGISSSEALSKAREASLKALEIDDSLTEAHASLAFIKFQLDWDWPAAEHEFQRAIDLNPGYVTAHHWYSIYLAAMGRCDESIHEFRRAKEIDPLSMIVRLDGGAEFFWCRHLDSAFEEIRQVIEMTPDYPQAHMYIAGAYAAKGMFAESEAEFTKGRDLAGGSTALSLRVFEAWLDAQSGKTGEARRILRDIQKLSGPGGHDDFFAAATYATLGDRDAAFRCLENAYRKHSYWMVYLKVEPRIDPLRDDPRFKDLLQRMHLD